MSRPRVFVTREIPAAGLNRLRAECDVDVWPGALPPSKSEVIERVKNCDALLALLTEPIDAEVMDAAPNLKVISNYAVGVNNVDLDAATARGIPVGNTPGVLTESTADIAFCLLIAAARRLVDSVRWATDGHWKTWEPLGFIGQDLEGKTLGVVGMGRIGQALAKRCHGGWDMRVIYHSRADKPDADRAFDARRVDFDTLLAESDFISIHTDLNDTTHGMFGAEAFRKMKRTAVVVNTARGPVVDTDALVAALRENQIFAAGLDVTDPEPLPDGHPLYTMENVVIAPHVGSATVDSRDGMAEIAADNVLRGLKDEPLRACVNPEVRS